METYLTRTGNPFIDLLDFNMLSAERVEQYFFVGLLPEKGWVLHISVVTADAYLLLSVLLPFLKQTGVAFAIPAAPVQIINICSGVYGNSNIGKVICIYPANDAQALTLAMKLVEMTRDVDGPRVSSDLYLGGTVYVSTERLETANELANNSEVKSKSPLPEGVEWPFGPLASSIPVKKVRKLNGKYIAFHILKEDPKGSVIKAIRRRNFFDFKWVIVKLGNKHMCSDSVKQDIRTRLRWQQTVAGKIGKRIHTPTVFEYFEVDEDGYLVMEFIKGIPLREFIMGFYKQGNWLEFTTSVRILLIEKLIEIVKIVTELHALEFVHRDLTTMNFVLKRKELYLLDMELVYSLADRYPKPVFGVGSKGYMSPEQEARAVPTVNEDIYAVGAIMQKFFTGLDPYRLWLPNHEELRREMFFFLQDDKMTALVAACLGMDPAQRPTIVVIMQALLEFKDRILQKGTGVSWGKADMTMIRNVIQCGIVGLGNFLTNDGYWASRNQEQGSLNPNEQSEYLLYGGLHHGAMGVIYLLSRAREMDFEISSCSKVIDISWQLTAEHYLQKADQQVSNLSDGMAGVALGLMVAARAGLLPVGWNASELALVCFQSISAGIEVYKGLSGQGIGVTLLAREQPQLQVLIPEILGPILSQQTPKGNWLFPNAVAEDKSISYPGLMNGNAGITYFLLLHWAATRDVAVEQPIRNALTYLRNDFKMKKGKFVSHENPPLTLFYGLSGIALTFIKAFEVLEDPADQKFAEDLLSFLPERVLFDNLTISYGITGIGEVYLEAYRVFGNEHWLDRADYIAQALVHMAKTSEDGGKYWLTDPSLEQLPTPDLMVGNAGVVHFLLRYLEPGRFGFPMFSI